MCVGKQPRYLSTIIKKVKIKVTLQNTTKGPTGSRGMALLFFHLGARWGGWATPCPDRFIPGKTRYPLYRRSGGPQNRYEQV